MRQEQWDTRLIGQIHDSMVLDVHPDELIQVTELIHKITCHDLAQHWSWITVPMEVEMELAEVDHSWAELKPYVFSK